MSEKVVMLTGGSGFVGQMLQVGLRKRGYGVRVFDQFRGAAVNLLRRRQVGEDDVERLPPWTSSRA